MGRATYSIENSLILLDISIHALRGEGDNSVSTIEPRTEAISIHALRGEGDSYRKSRKDYENNFNPRPPWGGRPRIQCFVKALKIFQSTPSVGRATIIFLCISLYRSVISIHALRGEGDNCSRLSFSEHYYFNPRPPWGGRLLSMYSKHIEIVISIHALRGEGDARIRIRIPVIENFNPRPPWGGRQNFV